MKSWIEITSKFIGTPYEYGGEKPGESIDCLQFLIQILESQGYKVNRDEKIENIGLDNYRELSDHNFQNKLLFIWIRKNTDQISWESRPGQGDIAIVKFRGKIIPGILDSNMRVIVCTTTHGIKLISNLDIIEFRRWRN